ncbi:MAG: hypothetical protein RLZZ283_321 [Candidatus Parcubacteria bacterium]|jgi:PTH1 family peptidyl-tRNA hydrolase
MSTHLIVGLGNPDKEHEQTRHNAGRMAVEFIRSAQDFVDWKTNSKPPFLESKGKIGAATVTLMNPNTYMNKSGAAVAHYIKNKKGAGNTIVIYDDLDLPLGTIKISYGRSSGGHNGVESVIKALKTRDFPRIRIGVSRKSAKGVAIKPSGEDKVLRLLLGRFTSADMTILKKVFKEVNAAVETIIAEGREIAMTRHNG